MAFVLRWGIMATGWIANEFVVDLLLDPTERGTHDVRHEVAAVASSGSLQKAQDFIQKVKAPTAKAYGTYEELVADGTVDIIYIATPQSRHYQDVMLSLNAGKHVLCEKPFTINAPQATRLAGLAKSKGRFLMEAAWTRFFPHTKELVKLLHDERTIGSIRRVSSDFSLRIDDSNHRLLKPELGGGALLDLGFYPLLWAIMILYKHPENEGSFPKVSASIVKTKEGVDAFTSATLYFEKLNAVAHLTTSLYVTSISPYSTVIQGDQGDVLVAGLPCHPEGFNLRVSGAAPFNASISQAGKDLIWQADETARAIRDGKDCCSESPVEDTIVAMQILDEIRRQGDFTFPAPLEDI